MEQTTLKKCTKCGDSKPATAEFYPEEKWGLRNQCKSCRGRYSNERRIAREAERPEARALRLAQRKEFRQQHPERIKEQKRDSYLRNRESCLLANKRFHEENPNWRKEYNTKYYAEKRASLLMQKRTAYWVDPEKMRARSRAWRADHPEIAKKLDKRFRPMTERRRINNRVYAAIKRKIDPLFVLKMRIRSRIHNGLRAIGKLKTMHTEMFIGCSFAELKIHVERQFTKGMTWENRDQWHIDHIIPLSTAKTEEDVIRLNHYTNLRPLWAKDNLAKSDKVEFLL